MQSCEGESDARGDPGEVLAARLRAAFGVGRTTLEAERPGGGPPGAAAIGH